MSHADPVAAARAYCDAHALERITLPQLAAQVGMSPFHLQRVFTRVVGVSPKRYLGILRANALKAELRRGATVSRATFAAGYGSSSRAYAAATTHLAMTPGAYRRGGQGITMRVTTVDSRVGSLLVAATPRGLCAVSVGSERRALLLDWSGSIRGRRGGWWSSTISCRRTRSVSGRRRSGDSSTVTRSRSICPRTSRARRSRNAFGARWRRSRSARRVRMRRSRRRSALRGRRARWRALARATGSCSSSRATGW